LDPTSSPLVLLFWVPARARRHLDWICSYLQKEKKKNITDENTGILALKAMTIERLTLGS
jgi:hypothetical protein